jgi:adenylate cyclase
MGKSLKKLTVICVDDEEMILVSLRSQLRGLNDQMLDVQLELFQNAQEALEMIEELIEEGESIPLVISDQIMPGMKGDEFLSRVHQIIPQSKTILLTGQASIDAVQRAVNDANLYRYLTKPWEQSDLLLTTKEAIRSWDQDRQIAIQQERIQKLNEVFARFVPKPFLDRLAVGEKLENLSVGFAQRVDLTILFSDIRGFTSFSEQMAPEELLSFLNEYLSYMNPCIHHAGGFIDKFIGDAIMALFDESDHSQHAGEAALEMILALAQFNQKRKNHIKMGIGIHRGVVMMGTVGTNQRMDSTVIGDVVNVASRLEGLSKTYGCSVLISEDALLGIKHTLPYRYLGEVQVKGREAALKFFELYSDIDPQMRQRRTEVHHLFASAISLYEQALFTDAQIKFQEYLAHFPKDGPSSYYDQKCEQLKHQPELWSKVHKMTDKS